MEFWTVTLISVAAGLVLVIGGALVVYMGSLVKSAYQLKIEIQGEMADGQRKVEEDVDKKLRWIKRDLVEEVEKIKGGLQADSQRRIAEMAAAIDKRLAEAAEEWRRDRAETLKVLEGLRHDMVILDQRQRSLRREQRASTEAPSGDVAGTTAFPAMPNFSTGTAAPAAAEPLATPAPEPTPTPPPAANQGPVPAAEG